IEAEQRLKEAKRTVNAPTKKHGHTQKSQTSPDEAPLEHPGTVPWMGLLTDVHEQLRRQLHEAATAKRKAEERVNMLEKKFEELQYSSYQPREPLERQTRSGVSAAEAGPSSSVAESSSPPSNPGEVHGVDPLRHHNSQWDHTKAASQAPLDADEATSEDLRDGRAHGANLPGGTLQRPEQTEEIHRGLDNEATAGQKVEAKVDRLEKELRELRDIISVTSHGPLERQTHPGLSSMEAGPSTSTARLSTSPSRSSTSFSDPEQSSSNFARFYANYKPPGRA
ncbi:hypothetical protein BU15DRAFT_59942, partial [Melanogaster broomeanus]